MTVTIHVPPERRAALESQAKARGMSIEAWLLDLAEQAVSAPEAENTNLVEVCAQISGLAEDVQFDRNSSAGRTVEL